MPIPIVMIVGSTGVGKTKLSIDIAKQLGGEIIGIDSIQIYDMLDVTSAKPTQDEQQGIPHHCVSSQPWYQPIELQSYLQQASDAIESIHKRGKIPIVVGGTFYYCEQLLLNTYAHQSALQPATNTTQDTTITPPAASSQDHLAPNPQGHTTLTDYSRWLTTQSTEQLYTALMNVDPDRALIIGKNNRKLRRNLELIFEHKITVTALYGQKPNGDDSINLKNENECPLSTETNISSPRRQKPNTHEASSCPMNPSDTEMPPQPPPSQTPQTQSFLITNRLKYDVCMLWIDADIEVIYERCLKRVCDMVANHLLLEVLELFHHSINIAHYSYDFKTGIFGPSGDVQTGKTSTSSQLSFFSPMGKMQQYSSLQLVNTTLGIWQCIGSKELLPWLEWLHHHGLLQTTCSCKINAQSTHTHVKTSSEGPKPSPPSVCGCCVFISYTDPLYMQAHASTQSLPHAHTDKGEYRHQYDHHIPIHTDCNCQRSRTNQILTRIFSNPDRLLEVLSCHGRAPCAYTCPFSPPPQWNIKPKGNIHHPPSRLLKKHVYNDDGELTTTLVQSSSHLNETLDIDQHNKQYLACHVSGDITQSSRLFTSTTDIGGDIDGTGASTGQINPHSYSYNPKCDCMECQFRGSLVDLDDNSVTGLPTAWCVNISLLAHCLHEIVLATVKLAKQQQKWIASRLLLMSTHLNRDIPRQLIQSCNETSSDSLTSSGNVFWQLPTCKGKAPIHGNRFNLYKFDSSTIPSKHPHTVHLSWEIVNMLNNAQRSKKKHTSADNPWITAGEFIKHRLNDSPQAAGNHHSDDVDKADNVNNLSPSPCRICQVTIPLDLSRSEDWKHRVGIPAAICTYLYFSRVNPLVESHLQNKRKLPTPAEPCDTFRSIITPRNHHVIHKTVDSSSQDGHFTLREDLEHQPSPSFHTMGGSVSLFQAPTHSGPTDHAIPAVTCACDYLLFPRASSESQKTQGPLGNNISNPSDLTGDKTPIFCDVCDITCIGQKQWQLHKNGKKHKYFVKQSRITQDKTRLKPTS